MNTANIGPVYVPYDQVGPNIVGYTPEQINYRALPTVDMWFLASDQAKRTAGIRNYNNLNYMKSLCSADPTNPYCEVAYTQGAPGEELIIQSVLHKYFVNGSSKHFQAFDSTRPYYGNVVQPMYTTQMVPRAGIDFMNLDRDPLIVKLITLSMAGKYRSQQADEIILDLVHHALAMGYKDIMRCKLGKIAAYINGTYC